MFFPAIILETKSEAEDISLQKWVKELKKNCNIVLKQYKHVVGILYNGQNIRVFLDNIEAESTAPTLQDKSYYLTLFTKNTIDASVSQKSTVRIFLRLVGPISVFFRVALYRILRRTVRHCSKNRASILPLPTYPAYRPR